MQTVKHNNRNRFCYNREIVKNYSRRRETRAKKNLRLMNFFFIP